MRVPFQLHRDYAVLQPFRRIELRTHGYLCLTRYSFTSESTEACEGKVSFPRTQYRNNVPILEGEKHTISIKILHQSGLETARQQRQCRSSTL